MITRDQLGTITAQINRLNNLLIVQQQAVVYDLVSDSNIALSDAQKADLQKQIDTGVSNLQSLVAALTPFISATTATL